MTVLLLLLLLPPGLAGAARAQDTHLAIRLVAETTTPAPGGTVTLALDTKPQAGWHGYWQNPGDAGFPATLDWHLPAGVTAGAPRYPVPQRLLIGGLMNYVFERPYAPLVDLKIPTGLAPGTRLPVRLHASYLVCTTSLCVPEAQDLSVDLTVGDGQVTPGERAQFDGWRRALPRPLGSPATVQVTDGQVRIGVPYPASAPIADGYFYPLTTGVIDDAAPQVVTRDGDRVVVATKAATTPAAGPVDGVLAIGGAGLAITARPGIVPPAATAASAATAADRGASVAMATVIAFLGALIGGLILNVMPCVFPILSLKALSLARGHLSERDARAEALAYAAGVVLVCLGLGALILGLRAGGASVGWAFQLQDPRAIVVLLLLTVAIALNLAGLFDMPTPRFAGKGGTSGAFVTGVLAAFVATPCTGPFMATALGAALVLPVAAALAVFGGLGLGLALPFLLLGFVPALRRRLPKPGGWMETFRRILSVPMWLTALALGWVLGKQAGVDGLTIGLFGALVIGLVLWFAGARQRRGLALGAGVAAAVLVVTIATALAVRPAPAAPAMAAAGAEPFSEARLAALRAANRPVFAYFTADWCLTCKVNEKAAIETAGVRSAFRRGNVAVLVGDWTSGDPVLGRFIEAHNRAGVPLYLYYAPGAAEPKVLPQILTPGLLEALPG